MAVRIEYILLLVFILLIAAVFGFEPRSKEAVSGKGDKEVHFQNFHISDLKEDNSGRQIYALEAIKYKNHFNFKEVNLTDELGHSIYSGEALYQDELLSLEKKVKVVSDENGLSFSTEHLNYDLKKKIMQTDDSFLLELNQSTIRGDKLVYEVENKVISADHIDASIWFDPKK